MGWPRLLAWCGMSTCRLRSSLSVSEHASCSDRLLMFMTMIGYRVGSALCGFWLGKRGHVTWLMEGYLLPLSRYCQLCILYYLIRLCRLCFHSLHGCLGYAVQTITWPQNTTVYQNIIYQSWQIYWTQNTEAHIHFVTLFVNCWRMILWTQLSKQTDFCIMRGSPGRKRARLNFLTASPVSYRCP